MFKFKADRKGTTMAHTHRRVRLGMRVPVVLTVLITSLACTSSSALTQAGPRRVAQYIGAYASNWGYADRLIGPLQADKIFYPPWEPLPARWPSNSYGLAKGALAIIAYKVPTTHVVSFVKSIPRNRPVTMVFWQEPEAHLSASQFLSEFEQQSRLIQSAHRPNVEIADDAAIYRYQSQFPQSYNCQYVPPSRFVNYYYGDAYELNDQTLRDLPQFQRWTYCTAHRGHRRGLAEYGVGDCEGPAHRARTIAADAAYLKRNYPHLQVLSYWWSDTSPNAGTSCHTDWQFTSQPVIDTWKAIESGGQP